MHTEGASGHWSDAPFYWIQGPMGTSALINDTRNHVRHNVAAAQAHLQQARRVCARAMSTQGKAAAYE